MAFDHHRVPGGSSPPPDVGRIVEPGWCEQQLVKIVEGLQVDGLHPYHFD